MTTSPIQALDTGAVQITARDWAQMPDVDPGDGLITVYKAASDNAYDINISNDDFEEFYQYWYTWVTPSGIEQDDTLYTQIYGTFAMGGGNDSIIVDINPSAYDGTLLSSYLLGGSGDDVISAAPGNFNIMSAYGGSGDDSIDGGFNTDLLYGDEVDAFYLWPTTAGFIPQPYDASLDGNDTIDGHEGNDTIVGGGGDDILTGGQDDDLISAASGKNQLFGGEGADTLVGGTGSDFLYGGPRGSGQDDIMTGGGGADVFMLSYAETSNQGAAFWGQFFEGSLSTVTGDAVENGLSDIFKDGLEGVSAGFISAALGGVGQALVDGFLSWIESLGPSATPQEDVLVVRDFDPSQDILVLPTFSGVDLSESAPENFNPDNAGDYRTGIKFIDDNTSKVYAELTLSTDFLTSVGLTQDDSDDIARILNFITANPTRVDAATGNFTSLSNVSAYITDGGFTPPSGAHLPTGTSVVMFGAIGGLVYHSEPGDYSNSFIVGTQYADVLTINPVIKDPTTLDISAGDFTTTQSEVHGLGGDDLIYGSNASDILHGGDGNDTIYSFLPDQLGEEVSGGNGNDFLYGGGSFGSFDGGAGSDTFGVFYGQVVVPMQLYVDLATGIAGERAAPSDTSAPVGAAPPFTAAADNTYTLTGIENVLGGSLNDWIRMTAGGTAEGGAGADYIDATAGGVTFSYEGSSEGVVVQLFASDAVTSGGDAEGDVIDYQGGSPSGLVGSDQADTLGGSSSMGFSFTGHGGADVFQILGVTPSTSVIDYTITDFSFDDGDLIDLRAIGATRAEFRLLDGGILITNPGGTSATILITLEHVNGPILPSSVLVVDAVSGVGHTAAGGGGLSGGSGNDVLLGQAGADFLFGNAGDDLMSGLGGADIMDGGRGNDQLRGNDGDDRLTGGDGDDTLLGGAGDDLALGGRGEDHMWGGAGDDRLLAGAGDDWVVAGEGDDLVNGGAGNDSLWGGAGADRILAAAGDDRILGGDGDDLVAGGIGNDSVWAGTGNDRVQAGDGNDLVFGDDGDDVIVGGAGNDRLHGGDGRDLLLGQDGNDQIFGGAGADWVFGGAGNDTLDGGAGRDIIDGGAGIDVMRGGGDADIFRLALGASDGDSILDFNATEGDRLVVLNERAIGISDLGDGLFSFTDGVTADTVLVTGATLADFDLLIG